MSYSINTTLLTSSDPSISADPMGYPDGWNQFAYCGNGVTGSVDLWGCEEHSLSSTSAIYQPTGLDEFHTEIDGLYFKVDVVAICSGDYDNLAIKYTISKAADSWETFVSPLDISIGSDVRIYDQAATFTNLKWEEKNLEKEVKISGYKKTVSLSFNLELQCTVTAEYKYRVKDTDGTYVWLTAKGSKTIVLNTKPIKFTCSHFKE